MEGEDRVRIAFERNTRAISLRPAIGQGTAVTRVRLREGLTCEIEDGAWKLTADLTEKSGGNNRGPNPGVLGRSALASCLAMAYTQWAAKLGVPIAALEVEVQADYDTRGMYGVDGVGSDYRAVRYVVTVESDAPEAEVLRMLDKADTHCPYYNVFSRPQNLQRELRLIAPAS
jgi:uncharacterized OsmC-like protein